MLFLKPTLIPVSSLTFAEKGGFRDCVGIFLIWQYLGIKVNVPTNHITAVSLLLPFQLLKDSCDTHIMLTQIRPEFGFSHLYPESSFASSPICSAVRKVAHGAGERWKERTPAVAWLFDVAAPLTVNYEAHFYALDVPGIGHTPLICIRAEW